MVKEVLKTNNSEAPAWETLLIPSKKRTTSTTNTKKTKRLKTKISQTRTYTRAQKTIQWRMQMTFRVIKIQRARICLHCQGTMDYRRQTLRRERTTRIWGNKSLNRCLKAIQARLIDQWSQLQRINSPTASKDLTPKPHLQRALVKQTRL